MKQVVVQVVQHLAPGGIECMVLDLLKHATAEQVVHVISLEGDAGQLRAWPRLMAFADRLHFLSKPSGISPAMVWRLRQLMRELKADVVHTHHIGPLLYGGAAARLAGIPVLLHTEHDTWHLQDPRRLRLAKRLLTMLQPQVVANSTQVQRHLANMMPACRSRVIFNGINVQHFRPHSKAESRASLGLPVAEDVMLVGCAARLEAVKGHQFLLEAAFRLPQYVHLALAGGGSLREALETQAQELDIGHRVHFLGHVEQMDDFYRALDVFCLPSLNEGMPLSLLEAQACGVPVVATRVGGVAEAVCPQTGLLVKPGAALALANALQAQLKNTLEIDPRPFVLRGKRVQDMVSAYAALSETLLKEHAYVG